ncbi:hypothetical protein [Spirillospora sp. NPDC048819]|uniref:hypothetical protein n=1 Tax=Spirillospora sp. NPDC048819 TaxID=3155268 RepID=UPI003401EE82
MTRALARMAASCAAAVLALSLTAGPASADGPWHTVALPFFWDHSSLLDVAAAAPDQVWISGKQGEICVQVAPMTPCLIYRAGNPVVRRWDGSGWREYPIQGWSGQGSIRQVAAGAGQTWILGRQETAGAYLARFDGSAFVPEAGPSGGSIQVLRAGPAGVWAGTSVAAETGDSLYRRSGGGWTGTPIPEDLRYVNDVKAFTATDAWAVGQTEPPRHTYGSPEHPALAHWDGNSWTSVLPHRESGPKARIVAVAPSGPGRAWVVTRGEIAHWDGTGWTAAPAPEGTSELQDVAVDGAGAVWVTARMSGPPRLGLFRYENGTWHEVVLDSVTGATDIAASPGGAAWALARDEDGKPSLITTD